MKNPFRTRTSSRRRSTQRRNFLRLECLENRSLLTGMAPVAVNDHYETLMDTSVGDHGPGILLNDTDAEGDPLTSSLFSGPANGTLNLNSDGSFLYTPNAGFVGTDSFMYFAHDGESASDLAAVTIEVGDGSAGAPVSADDSYNVEEDGVLNIGFTEGVLGNDTDPDGDSMTAAVVDGPANGTLSLASDGSFTYIPNADFTGTDTFTYVASDGSNEGNLATVTITIDPVNDGPTIANDAYSVDEDGSLVATDSVLLNDTDPDGDTLTPTLVSGPLNGTVELNADGTFTYTPTANFNGLDGFSYSVSDGTVESEVATVTITVNPVNDLPISNNDEYTTQEDTPLDIPAPGVLENDEDIDADDLAAILVSPPQFGTISLNSDGSFLYTPNADYNGVDGFSYLAGDGTGESEVAGVTIHITGVNDGPLAAADAYTVDEDAPLSVTLPGVLTNDTDAEGDTLTAALVTGPTNGTLTLNSDGSFEYVPTANFSGSDSFTYTASDGTLSSEATVTITVNPVNDGPEATDDEYATDEDTTLTVDLPGVLGNDTDPEGDPLSATVVTGPANGTLTLNTDGSFSYTPAENFSGEDSFTYSVSDGSESGEATVTITVNPVNDGPVATGDAYEVDEDSVLAVDAPGLMENDSDPDGDPLMAAVVSGPANGTVEVQSDGSFVYTPNENFSGEDTFTYSVGDGTATAEATVTITVNPTNDDPLAVDDAYEVEEDSVLTIDAPGLMENDSDPDGDPLTAAVVTGPTNGTVEVQSDGSFVYTPNANFAGDDSFTYSISDGTTSAEATVSITVTEMNDIPAPADDAYEVDEDTVLTVAAPGILENDIDPEGDPLSATLVTGPSNGTLALNSDGSFSYTPNANFNGTDSFTYSAGDGTEESEATVTITVNPFPDAPAVSSDAYSVGEDLPLVVDAGLGVLANDFDPEGLALTATVVTGPTNGTLTLNTDGSFSYTPNENWNGTDTFTYLAQNGSGEDVEGTVSIVVEPLNDMPLAADDTFDVPGGELAESVVGNDSDVDGDTLSVNVLFGPHHGELAMNSDGTFVYTADEGFIGDDEFFYQLNDGMANSAVAHVTLHVLAQSNALPESAPDQYTVETGQTLTVDAPGVLENDSDGDGDTLSAELVSTTTSGTLTLNADGSFSYVPNAGFTGEDSFTYQASDGTGAGEVTTVTITVEPESTGTPIVAADDAYEVDAETPLVVALPGVLANDVDPEGDPLTVTMVDGPTNGTLTLNADGSFTYTPAIGFSGSDTFTYQASDGTGVSNVATVTVSVGSLTNTRPDVANDSYTVEQDNTLDVPAEEGVLVDDSDPDGDAITASLFAEPQHGTVTLNSDGSFTYTPEAGFVGRDSFLYWAYDGELHSILAAVTIHVTAAEPGPIPGPEPIPDPCDPEPDPCDPQPDPCSEDDHSQGLDMIVADETSDELPDAGETSDELLDSLVDPPTDENACDLVICEGLWLS